MSNTLKEIQLDGEALIYKAYELGYETGRKAYDKGLEDAWKCARKIMKTSITERQKLFNTVSVIDIFNILSPSSAMDKIKEYEESKEADVKKVEVTEENFRMLCEALEAVAEAECCSYEHDEAFDMAEHYMEQIKEVK